jgi:hypothetical protein
MRRSLAGACGLCALAALACGAPPAAAITCALLLFLPGFLIDRVCGSPITTHPLVQPCIWLGLSVAVLTLAYLWCGVVGLQLGDGALALGALLVVAASLWALWRAPAAAAWRPNGWWFAGALVVGLTIWTRSTQAAGLVFPPWVDGVHHALLVRVVAERGAPPYDLEPYLPVAGLIYHWGYHALIATMLRLGGTVSPLELPATLLWSGQALGALQAAAWGAAALHLWRRPAAAVAAALVVGLGSIMPAYYLSWGRYTLLTGMLLLPAVLVAADVAIGGGDRRALTVAALLLAGLSMVHFVVLIFALVWCGVTALLRWRARAIGDLLLLGGATLGATLPWFVLLVGRARAGAGSSAVHLAGNADYNQLPLALLWAESNPLLVALAALGALIACWARQRAAAALLIWCCSIVLLANPTLVGLPYLSLITNEFVAITLFAPAALLIAGGAAVLERRLGPRLRTAATIGAIVLAIWCAAGFRSIVRADTILAGADDMQAIEWVMEQTPAEARLAVNAAGWLYDVDRGADGGWWLSPLAGRQVSVPPVLFNYGAAEYAAAVKRETAALRAATGDPAEAAAFMRANGYRYAYATERGPAFTRARLAESSLFVEVYRNTSVSIFALRAAVAP